MQGKLTPTRPDLDPKIFPQVDYLKQPIES